MNTQFTSESPLFQDHQLPDTTPRNSWKRLTAGDEQADRFEGFLRSGLVVSLFCTVLICGLRFRPAADAAVSPQPTPCTAHVQPAAEPAPVAVQAETPKTVALN